jgi:uncharacterized protein YuzE
VKIEYDRGADAAYVRFSDALISRTEEESDVCVLDYDENGHLVAIELLSVFGFAEASLNPIVQRGLLSRQAADEVTRELRHRPGGGVSA